MPTKIDVTKIKETVKEVSKMSPEEKKAFEKKIQEQNSQREAEALKIADEQRAKKRAEIKKANRNRNLWIAGGMVLGAVGGFIGAKYFKAKTLGIVLSTIGGSVAVGLPIILVTRKKALERKKELADLAKAQVEQKAKSLFSKKGKEFSLDKIMPTEQPKSTDTTETPKMA